jgi:hypothetical protein
MKLIEIAGVCHEANRMLCLAHEDTSQPTWFQAPQWQRSSAVEGVRAIAAGRVTRPEQSHESWLEHKRAHGWTYGPEKVPDDKRHPCMVPFDQLPPHQQAKDRLFFAIATALLPLLEEPGVEVRL